MLSLGQMDSVRTCLGRAYRLVAAVELPSAGPSQQPGGNNSSSNTAPTFAIESFDADFFAPKLLMQGDQLVIPAASFLNQPPGVGTYTCTVYVHLGAGPEDELLHLEAAASRGCSSTGSSSQSPGHAMNNQAQSSAPDSSAKQQDADNAAGVSVASSTLQASNQTQQMLCLHDVQVHVASDGVCLPSYVLSGCTSALDGQSDVNESALFVLDFTNACRTDNEK